MMILAFLNRRVLLPDAKTNCSTRGVAEVPPLFMATWRVCAMSHWTTSVSPLPTASQGFINLSLGLLFTALDVGNCNLELGLEFGRRRRRGRAIFEEDNVEAVAFIVLGVFFVLITVLVRANLLPT